MHIGHYPCAAGGAEYLAGQVDEVRVYNRALSASEIVQLYGMAPAPEGGTKR